MLKFNLYAPGTRGPATLLGTFPDFPAALAAWEADNAAAWSIVPVGDRAALEPLGSLDSFVPGYDLGRYGRGVYCISAGGGGVSTMGYGYAAKQAAKVAAWLEREGKPAKGLAGPEGTPEGFAAYLAAMAAGRAYNAATGAQCPDDLTPELRGLEGKRVEVVDCHGETRRFYVGRSTGWLPIHLEIERRNSSGGGVTGAPFASVRVIGGTR